MKVKGKKMKQYGIFAWFGYLMPLERRLRLIRAAGFKHVMLWWGDEFLELDGDKTRHPELARRLGLRVENAHAPYQSANCLWEEGVNGDALEELLAGCITACARCEIPALVIHPTDGPAPPRPPGESGIRRLSRLAEKAGRAGVALALENVQRPEYLEYIFKRIGSEHLGLCYDCGHDFSVSGGLSLLERYGHLLRALHIHDNDGSEDQHLVPGEGKIDWAVFNGQLDALGYKGPVMLESCAPWSPDMDESRRERPEAYLRRVMEAARRLL